MSNPESKTIRVGELKVHYLEQGRGDPLVLVHGGLATAGMMWGRRIPELAKTYRVLAPDTRGHGGTNNPARKLGYDQMADDLAGFIDALGLEKPLIAGYSDGGQIAIEFGIRHPGKASALVIGGAISEPTSDYIEGLHSWGFTAPGQVDFAQLEKSFGEFFATIKTAHGEGAGSDYWKGFLAEIATLWLTVPHYTEAQLGSITDPALVIMGDRDDMAGSGQAERLYRALPDAELAIVPGSPHGAADRDIFWRIVEDFFDRRT